MNPVPGSEHTHIAVVGKQNVGKSSLVNALLGQDLCRTSNYPGTTVEAEKKTMELLPYGLVVIIDTVGIEEVQSGKKTLNPYVRAISSADVAIVVLNASEILCKEEKRLIRYLNKLSLPYIVAVNKVELGINPELLAELRALNAIHFEISCKENVGIDRLKAKLLRKIPSSYTLPLFNDLVHNGDVVIMVAPDDSNVPKGSLIEPQIQTIREALDEDAIVIITKERDFNHTLSKLNNPPDLVITESQKVRKIAAHLPENIKITTFSILMARYKGDIDILTSGLKRVNELNNGDKILIAEACSNHLLCDDICRVKIPQWLKEYTNKTLHFDISSGLEFPDSLSVYKLIIHCGACSITRRAMKTRLNEIGMLEIPVVNYGVLISYIQGVVPRVLLPFNEAISAWSKFQ